MYTVQRCWVHILREIHHVSARNPDSAEARRVLGTLKRTYNAACEERSPEERQDAHGKFLRNIRRMVKKYRDDPVLKKFMVTLRNADADLFRFVLDPELPSTNNAAERALREIVIHRKIRGGMRAEETMIWMGNLFTCITTLRLQGIDWEKEILQYL